VHRCFHCAPTHCRNVMRPACCRLRAQCVLVSSCLANTQFGNDGTRCLVRHLRTARRVAVFTLLQRRIFKSSKQKMENPYIETAKVQSEYQGHFMRLFACEEPGVTMQVSGWPSSSALGTGERLGRTGRWRHEPGVPAQTVVASETVCC
jgi:hypothetical protein